MWINPASNEFLLDYEKRNELTQQEILESTPYGYGFFTSIRDGWSYENLTPSFRVTGLEVTETGENEYYVKITINDLEVEGRFLIKNENYVGAYDFVATG